MTRVWRTWLAGTFLVVATAGSAFGAERTRSPNILATELTALDDISAMKHARYMRGGREALEHPDRFYQFVRTGAYKGARCLKLTTYGNWRYGIVFRGPKGAHKKGELFTASVYVRSDTKERVTLCVWADDGKYRPSTQRCEWFNVGRRWRQITASGALAADTPYVNVLVRVQAKGKDDPHTVYLDEVKLERGRRASPSEPNPSPGTSDDPNVRYRIDHVVPLCTRPPTLDGRLADPCWARATVLEGFAVCRGKGDLARQRTRVRMRYDAQNLYVAVWCEEPNVGQLKKLSKLRDKPDWGEDRIELFINVLGIPRPPTYYLSVTPFGVVCDQALGLGEWDPAVRIATGRTTDAWLLELALPLQSFGKRRVAGEVWRLNIGRHHRTSYTISTSLARVRDDFHEPARFVNVLFERAHPVKDVDVVCLSRGEMSPLANRLGTNRVVYRVHKRCTGPVALAFTAESKVGAKVIGRSTLTRTITDATALVEQPYRVHARVGETIVFRVNRDTPAGATLFTGDNELAKIRKYRHVWPVPDPLFEPLLDRTRQRHPRTNGFMTWAQPISRVEYYCAVQFGYEHAYARVRKETSDVGMHYLLLWVPHLPGNHKGWAGRWLKRANPTFEKQIAEQRTSGLAGPILYAPYYIIGVDKKGRPGTHFGGGAGWLPDPINRSAYVTSTREAVRRFGRGKGLWAVCAGDELTSHVLHWSKKHVFDKPRPPDSKAHPFLLAADREVREKYGFGKFGIPWGMKPSHPDYPYCRRAFRTWLVQKVREACNEMGRAVRDVDPDMLVISEDGHGGTTHGTEYWHEYATCITTQLQYHWPNAYVYGTKAMKDLSGLNEVMPLPHDCDSGFPLGELQPDELRELYSQLFRGGATSIHFWPGSLANRRPIPPYTRTVRSAHPYAWRYLIELCKFIRKMPPVKQPASADAALLVSRESEKCGSVNGRRIRAAFEVLGPRARGWFTFISDTQLAIGRARLADYKVVYVGDITYSDAATAQALVAYCRGGGTLVCGDPTALEHNINGESLAQVREQLFGVKVSDERKDARTVTVRDFAGVRDVALPVDNVVEKAYQVQVTGQHARVVATFGDRAPAIVENKLGTGRAVYFAWSPFTDKAIEHDGWQRLIKATYARAGCRFGYDIWRFTFPELKIDQADTDPPGVCLTANYAFWYFHRMVEGRQHNVATDGSYTIRADGREHTHSFPEGKLTNRLVFLRKPNLFMGLAGYSEILKFKSDPWVESFKGPGAAQVVFDFKRARVLDRVTTFFYGELAGVCAETSLDGRTWRPAAEMRRARRTGDEEVAALRLPLKTAAPARYLRVTFTRGPAPDAELALCQMEVWARGPGK